MEMLVIASKFLESKNLFLKSNINYKFFGKRISVFYCVNDKEKIYCISFLDLCKVFRISPPLLYKKLAHINLVFYEGIFLEKSNLINDYFFTIENAIKIHENLL